MRSIACEMRNVDDEEYMAHAEELSGAGNTANQWANEIDKELFG